MNFEHGESPNENDGLIKTALTLKAMSHPTRLRILCILIDRESNVQELVSEIGTTQGNISQHLGILRERNLLRARKDSNKVFYSVSNSSIAELVQAARSAFC